MQCVVSSKLVVENNEKNVLKGPFEANGSVTKVGSRDGRHSSEKNDDDVE